MNEEEEVKKKNKRVWKWVLLCLATPWILFFLLLTILYIPGIQNWAVKQATRMVSNATGMNASVKNVSLTFPLDLTLNDVILHQHQTDTLAYLGQLRTEVAFWPLLKSQIRVTGIHIDRLKAHTDTLIPALNINGEVEKLYLNAASMNWADGNVKVQDLQLKNADVEVTLLPDNTPQDTSATNSPWHILLQQAKLNNIHLRLNIPADTLSMAFGWEKSTIEGANIDLTNAAYGVSTLQMTDGYATYNLGKSTTPNKFNPHHIALSNLNLHVDSLQYAQSHANAVIHRLTFNEHSGFTVKKLEGSARMDSTGIYLPSLYIALPQSKLNANAKLEWSALKTSGKGEMKADLDGHISKKDVEPFLSAMLSDTLFTSLPDTPLSMNLQMQGNVDNLHLPTCRIEMDSVITLEGYGDFHHLSDSLKRTGEADIRLKTYQLDFMFASNDSSASPTFVIPHNLATNLHADFHGTELQAEADVNGACGTLTLRAGLNPSAERYRLRIKADSLNIRHFLPNDSLQYLTADIRMAGSGFDPYLPQTSLLAKAEIHQLDYGKAHLDSILLNAKLERHQYGISLSSKNRTVETQSHVEGIIRKDTLTANLTMDVPTIDFQTLQLSEKPLTVSFRLKAEGETDWREANALKTDLTGLNIAANGRNHRTKDLHVVAYTHSEETYAHTVAGDLEMTLKAEKGINTLINQLTGFTQTIGKQLDERKPALNEMTRLLPTLSLSLKAGEDNPICNFLRYAEELQFKNLDLDLALSPQKGIYADGHLLRFQTDSLEFDTIRLAIRQDTTAVRYNVAVSNAPNTQKPVFTALLNGNLASEHSDALLRFYDERKRLGLELGVNAALADNGIHLSLFPEHPTVAFRPFTLNDSNYVAFSDSGRVTANLALIDEKGTGLRFYSSPNEDALQDLTLDLAKIHMEEILKILPYAPDLNGVLDAELHYVNNAASNTFSGTLQVEDFIYEQYPIGTLGMEAVYLPTGRNHHLVALQLLHQGREIAAVQGSYDDKADGGVIDGELNLEKFPLAPINAFLPRDMVTMSGMLDGEISLNGPVDSPQINGELRFDSAKMHSLLYALDFRLDQTPLLINDNRLIFEQFNIYAQGKNPFTLNGNIDMSNPAHMKADLRMRASEYELLNAKESKNSLLYGKAFVSLFSTIKGELDDLVVRGTMNVLGKTDVTYILKDSPLTVEDRLGSMVTFVNFNDTLTQAPVKNNVSFGGMDVLMNVQIDQGTQVRVNLGSDNHVEVEGGGNLSLQYTPQGELLLTGRYTLNQGEMKYSLPVIPLKTFNIQSGSYVEFTGNPANPYLNVTATERVRTSVTEDKASRYVNFDVGVSITNSLDQMGLEFTLAAPEDVALQNQLAAMSAEERGKLAVTMLVTGMYTGTQGAASGGFNTNNALNSFLQNEISNIAGNALKTVDVSIGVEDNYAADGSAEGGTDYSFRFAKRFWNNRLSVIIGGRISTGNEVEAEKNNSFIDDISLEWRLDDSGTRYVKLFHTKNYESILEGEIIETGVGLVLRKKINKLGELFIFRKKKQSGQAASSVHSRKKDSSPMPTDNKPTPSLHKKEEEK